MKIYFATLIEVDADGDVIIKSFSNTDADIISKELIAHLEKVSKSRDLAIDYDKEEILSVCRSGNSDNNPLELPTDWDCYFLLSAKNIDIADTSKEAVNRRAIHNIVASTELSPAMRHIRDEYMVSVRGYLRPSNADEELFVKAEHAARKALEDVLLEGAR